MKMPENPFDTVAEDYRIAEEVAAILAENEVTVSKMKRIFHYVRNLMTVTVDRSDAE